MSSLRDNEIKIRRPTQFWAPLNTWLRDYMAANDKRPGSSVVRVWFEENAHLVWDETDMPTWAETRVHAKCLRTTEQVKYYFREYRARRVYFESSAREKPCKKGKRITKEIHDDSSTGDHSTTIAEPGMFAESTTNLCYHQMQECPQLPSLASSQPISFPVTRPQQFQQQLKPISTPEWSLADVTAINSALVSPVAQYAQNLTTGNPPSLFPFSSNGSNSLGSVNSTFLTAPVYNMCSISSACPNLIAGTRTFPSSYNGFEAVAHPSSFCCVPTSPSSNAFFSHNLPVLLVLNTGPR
ncbi:hypothetical protein CEUSTIGMA_g11262.t1 [Chlamydomonas eustigma]|uniref:Uncharacterized protein n=1 Tax=Chlamydomonas eustigma TaxID=1157962 RepID=A0A250XL80_9CHLO|nr:hypothetical protein CEUSTIGMA_g11262.t1 [Chlamydomonas eustigma]|eukprot:GAX83838.1 hypothetical protein CEUSTIGMA_g11262.t1 [Chlamydomonas eustigma]